MYFIYKSISVDIICRYAFNSCVFPDKHFCLFTNHRQLGRKPTTDQKPTRYLAKANKQSTNPLATFINHNNKLIVEAAEISAGFENNKRSLPRSVYEIRSGGVCWCSCNA